MQKSKTIRFIFIGIALGACARGNPPPPSQSPTEAVLPTIEITTPSPAPTHTITPSPTVPAPTEPPTPVPSPIFPAVTPHTDYPAVVFFGIDGIIFSNFDGSSKTVFREIPDPSDPRAGNDVATRTGTLVIRSSDSNANEHRDSLWIVPPGESPRQIARPETGWIEQTPISMDGSMVAYGVHAYSPEEVHQLWVAKTDGTENRLFADDTGRFITDPGPFRLIPIAWSADNTKIYLTTSTDSEATPVGLYVADLATDEIKKANTPQVTLWDLSFSRDRKVIVHTTFQWHPTEGLHEPGPPYTLNLTDLASGETAVLLQSAVDRYMNPILSPSGRYIAFTILVSYEEGSRGLYVYDLDLGSVRTVLSSEYGVSDNPGVWLSEDILVLNVREGPPDRFAGVGLYSLRVDGTDLRQIEEFGGYLLGVVQPNME